MGEHRDAVPPGENRPLLCYNDQGMERGMTAENAWEFETYLNKEIRRRLGNRPIAVE